VLKPEYPIMTQRLLIRPYTEADLDDLHDTQSRPEVARYLYDEAMDRAASAALLKRKMRNTVLSEPGDGLTLAVALPEAGPVIGDVLLRWVSEQHRQGEIGYVFNPRFGGKGFATEAAAAMLAIGFDGLGLHRIVGRLDARNEASARLLERLGMRREAHFVQNEFVKGEWCDELVYAITEPEWRRQHVAAG
jgi:RimJ/RimL family protein N-acetyltransferase